MKSKKQLRKEQENIDRIKREHDIKGLFELEDNDYFALVLHHFLWEEYESAKGELSELSHVKSTIWLSMTLWEIVEGDGVEGFFDASESHHLARYTEDTIAALEEIGMTPWAELFRRVADILPDSIRSGQAKENVELEDSVQEELDDINSQMYEYDGDIYDLVRTYAERNRADLETNLKEIPPLKEPDRQNYFIEKCRRWVQTFERENGRTPTACVTTFGCQMNARDSEKLVGILRQTGYEITDSEKADFVIFNTCTVRDNANQRVYGRLGELNGYKRKNPKMKIALCGCMMQEPAVIEKIKKSYTFVDLIFGTHNIFKFAELLWTVFENEQKGMIIDIWQDTNQIVEELPIERKYAFKSGINIMFGCDNFCSYCIVPYVRGRERSREPKDIIREIEQLVEDGVVEVMLLGQNVNSYGRNLENPMTFAQLLREVEKIEGLKRIRFMTSHPKDLSDELIQVMKESKKICRHLHLPLQSGSTEILNRMNRRYSKEQYVELALKIRREIPDIAITTDIIVGFPGETDADLEETIDVVRRVKYDNAFTFIYSKRTGTPAAAMEDQIPEEQVKKGFDRLLKVVQDTAREQAAKYQGQVMEALIEEVNENDVTMVTGRLSNNMLVHIPGNASMIGKIVPVSLDECHGFYYIGHMTDVSV